MAKRIARWEVKGNGDTRVTQEINEFINDTKTGEKPTLNEDYSKKFNVVDKFNKNLSYISFLPKMTDEDIRIFIAFIEIAIVQARSLYVDWKNTKENVKEFAKALSDELNES